MTGDKTSDVSATYNAGLQVPSFELDLFGRVRSLTHVQLERYLATEAGARATRLSRSLEGPGIDSARSNSLGSSRWQK